MRKTIILAAFLLAGCVSQASKTHDLYQHKYAQEMSAWEHAGNVSKQECGDYNALNISRENVSTFLECKEQIAQRIAVPLAIDPLAANNLLLDSRRDYTDFKNKKIDRDELKIELQQSWLSYQASIHQQYQNSMAEAQQKDAASKRAFGQALQNTKFEMPTYQVVPPMKAPTVTTTDCREVFGGMRCTTR
ncbi:MAG: hypothetical protein H6863_00695 [Rhodospirillales bacterium]|nr:hypothetical protein [Rhodospirillales bacterium]MCB9979641.1 hypothetical protein [Rhodospirillales bacterium]